MGDNNVNEGGRRRRADLLSFLLALEQSFKGPLYKKLIDEIRKSGDVDATISGLTAVSGMTMLQVAVAHGDSDTASRLLELGADCNARDRSGTPLLLSRLKILRSLLREQSDEIRVRKEVDMIKLVLKGGADPSLRDPSPEEKEISGRSKDALDYAGEIPDETVRKEIVGLISSLS